MFYFQKQEKEFLSLGDIENLDFGRVSNEKLPVCHNVPSNTAENRNTNLKLSHEKRVKKTYHSMVGQNPSHESTGQKQIIHSINIVEK